jgi:hypothetical protein
MNPQNANPKNFLVEKIIYNQDGFSIAIGVWQDDQTRRFAMRWNGDGDNIGYPSYAGNPMWFQLPDDIRGILAALISNSNPMMP